MIFVSKVSSSDTGSHYNKDSKTIEAVQRRATKLVQNRALVT